MDTPSSVHQSNNTMYRVIIVSVFLLFILIVLYFGFRQEPKTAKSAVTDTNVKEQITSVPENGSMKVTSTATTYKVGQVIPIQIVMDSQGKDITGFDVLLGYDPADMSVMQIQSSMPQYQLFQFQKPSYFALTGTKTLSVQSPVTLSNSSVITATIRFNTPGTKTIALVPTEGRERTKMVDAQTNLFVPSISSLQLEIQ